MGGTAQVMDRSIYRHGEAARKSRVTHTLEMSKDLERPPLVKPSRPVYDDNDPYVVQMVNQRAMTFNADTVGRAVEPRSDYCPNMNQTIDRDKAGQGTRLLQNDMATLVKKNGGLTETTGQLSV